jgi:hypothetical protein
MRDFWGKVNHACRCRAEAYEFCGQRRYRMCFAGADCEYDIDGRTFEEIWEPVE